MVNRKAFTLIEVLISIFLMGLIMVPLFNVVEMMRNSNEQLLHSLEKSTQITKATKVLFQDIMASDGNFTLKKDEMSRFCIEETTNSLYELPLAKVCWLVLKDKNTLVRAEGNGYKLPLKYEDHVEVDTIMPHIEMFDVYREKNKDKVLVVIKQKEKAPISFLVQGIWKPKPHTATGELAGFPVGTKKLPDGTILLPDGTRYPPGTRVGKDGLIRLKNGKIPYNSNGKPKRGISRKTDQNRGSGRREISDNKGERRQPPGAERRITPNIP